MSRHVVAAALTVMGGLLVGACAPQPSRQPVASAPSDSAAAKPRATGYAQVNGIRLYYEIYGEGEPLVLLAGGFMTAPEMMPMIRPLAAGRKVIAPELQGHGRTADTDRPLRLETMGDDIAGLLDHLNIERADLVGYSLGADVALRTAIQHPERVRRLVVMSAPFARRGWYPEALAGMDQVGSKMADQMQQTPTYIMSKDWPQPERFPQFLDKVGALMAEDYDWSAEIRRLRMPVMLLYPDHDAIPTRHIAEFFALLGGGLKDAGWQNTQLTNARLAIVPGYSHYNFFTAPELGPIIEKFLADSLTGPRGGDAAAASKAAK